MELHRQKPTKQWDFKMHNRGFFAVMRNSRGWCYHQNMATQAITGVQSIVSIVAIALGWTDLDSTAVRSVYNKFRRYFKPIASICKLHIIWANYSNPLTWNLRPFYYSNSLTWNINHDSRLRSRGEVVIICPILHRRWRGIRGSSFCVAGELYHSQHHLWETNLYLF